MHINQFYINNNLILYTKLHNKLSLKSLLQDLPSIFHISIGAYYKNEFRKTQSVVGRLLLLNGLKNMGINYKDYKLSYNRVLKTPGFIDKNSFKIDKKLSYNKGGNSPYKGKKPYLLSKISDNKKKNECPTVYFNISHSKDIVVCALSKTQEIGVDIEYCNKSRFSLKNTKPTRNTLEKLYKIMSYDEIQYIGNHKNPLLAFYKLWTRKEAILKCLGIGISFSELPKVELLKTTGFDTEKRLVFDKKVPYDNSDYSSKIYILKDNIHFHDKKFSLNTIKIDKDYILSYAFF